jgi:hypothetical protein
MTGWKQIPERLRRFGPNAVEDSRRALRYLLGDDKGTPNDRVRHLYGLIEADRNRQDFALTVLLIVYGRLDNKASDSFEELKGEYQKKKVSLILQQMEDVVDEFLVGSSRTTDEINLDLGISGQAIRLRDYCYFLCPASDLFRAFRAYGWRLFDLNLRYEIRNSSINGDIVSSLKHARSRKQFHHYNNGLIVVAKNYALRDRDTRLHLKGAQIVNGLQTLKSIYNAVSLKEVALEQLDDCLVQIKAIQTSGHSNEQEFISQIVQSTNNQNPMAPRNLKANTREQRVLRTEFASLVPRWFYQAKEGEWESLTQEGGRFFKEITGHPVSAFKPEPQKRKARVIDNQDAAKAWLAFIGFADKAGDRVAHYFTDTDLYELAFTMTPGEAHWDRFANAVDFTAERMSGLENHHAAAPQYLLAYLLWQFTKGFIPSALEYRRIALDEGVKAGRIEKSSGSITSPESVQDAFLAESGTYQIWRLMSNMKELLVESASHILARKYGPLESAVCLKLLDSFDGKTFLKDGDIRAVARAAASASDLDNLLLFSRVYGLLRHTSGQFWEEKRKLLLSTSRLRTRLLDRVIARDFKKLLWESADRKMLNKAWKPEGKTFLESLPNL